MQDSERPYDIVGKLFETLEKSGDAAINVDGHELATDFRELAYNLFGNVPQKFVSNIADITEASMGRKGAIVRFDRRAGYYKILIEPDGNSLEPSYNSRITLLIGQMSSLTDVRTGVTKAGKNGGEIMPELEQQIHTLMQNPMIMTNITNGLLDKVLLNVSDSVFI